MPTSNRKLIFLCTVAAELIFGCAALRYVAGQMGIDTPLPPTLADQARGRVGEVVGGSWRLDALLGVGGSAAVYRASSTHGGPARALKLVHAHLRRHPLVCARIRREATIADRIEHRAVVRVLLSGSAADGAMFLVTELLEGSDLERARVASGGRLPIADVLRVGDELLEVLEIAHACGIVHRDIKPSNLFRSATGEIKVLDFGLARALETEDPDLSALTGGDDLLGTAGFMSPEQAAGRWDLVDAQADLWAVGATLLKLATGLDVHEAKYRQERVMLAATRPVAPVRDRASDLPPALARFLDRALAFSRRDRFADARQMREALRACCCTASALGDGAPTRHRRGVRDRSFVVAAVVAGSAGLVGLACLGGLVVPSSGRGDDAAALAMAPAPRRPMPTSATQAAPASPEEATGATAGRDEPPPAAPQASAARPEVPKAPQTTERAPVETAPRTPRRRTSAANDAGVVDVLDRRR